MKTQKDNKTRPEDLDIRVSIKGEPGDVFGTIRLDVSLGEKKYGTEVYTVGRLDTNV